MTFSALLTTLLAVVSALGLGAAPQASTTATTEAALSLTIEGRSPVLTGTDGLAVTLTPADALGDGEDTYTGCLPGAGSTGEPIEVTVYSALKAPDLDAVAPEPAPRETAPGDPEVHEESLEVIPEEVDPGDLQPILAHSRVAGVLLVALPEGSRILDVAVDGRAVGFPLDESSPGSLTLEVGTARMVDLEVVDEDSQEVRHVQVAADDAAAAKVDSASRGACVQGRSE